VRYDDVARLTRAVPFRPFRVVLADGRAFDILYPDMILPTRTTVGLGIPSSASPPDGVERVEYVAPDGIRALEPLPP
jgi:hypothetical protein